MKKKGIDENEKQCICMRLGLQSSQPIQMVYESQSSRKRSGATINNEELSERQKREIEKQKYLLKNKGSKKEDDDHRRPR